MSKVFLSLLWLIQVVCLATILVCAWLLFDRELFALSAAVVVLVATLYIEHTMPEGES
jgi:hypothetical protein